MNISMVAKRAGVSKATVSRVINGTARVVPETAKRVRKAIKELDYYPDINARTLGSGRSGLYGLIISDITNPYFPELVKAFEDIAIEHGQEVLISNTGYDPKRMERCVIRMLQRKVDGLAVMTSEFGEHLIEPISKRKIPTIFMDAKNPIGNAILLNIDYAAGVNEALEHLVELGHTRIAFISGPLGLGSARSRAEAFHAGLRARGLMEEKRWVQEGDHRVDGGREAMERILSEGDAPTALLASNDLTAIGAMDAIRQHGLRIPEDISVIGFDDIQLSAFTQPPLTTVHVPRGEVAATAFRSLFHEKDEAPIKRVRGREHVIKPHLLVRGSTAVAVKKISK